MKTVSVLIVGLALTEAGGAGQDPQFTRGVVVSNCGAAKEIFTSNTCCKKAGGTPNQPFTDAQLTGCPVKAIELDDERLPFPLPDSTLLSTAFDHYMHCKSVVDKNGKGRAGAVITETEHFNHCKEITDAADAGSIRMGFINSCSTPEKCVAIDFCIAMGLTDFAAIDMFAMQRIDTRRMDASMMITNNVDAKTPITSLPTGCQNTKQYHTMQMGWNHESLVAKKARSTANSAETKYLESWSSIAIGNQYAIAKSCMTTSERLPIFDIVFNPTLG